MGVDAHVLPQMSLAESLGHAARGAATQATFTPPAMKFLTVPAQSAQAGLQDFFKGIGLQSAAAAAPAPKAKAAKAAAPKAGSGNVTTPTSASTPAAAKPTAQDLYAGVVQNMLANSPTLSLREMAALGQMVPVTAPAKARSASDVMGDKLMGINDALYQVRLRDADALTDPAAQAKARAEALMGWHDDYANGFTKTQAQGAALADIIKNGE